MSFVTSFKCWMFHWLIYKDKYSTKKKQPIWIGMKNVLILTRDKWRQCGTDENVGRGKDEVEKAKPVFTTVKTVTWQTSPFTEPVHSVNNRFFSLSFTVKGLAGRSQEVELERREQGPSEPHRPQIITQQNTQWNTQEYRRFPELQLSPVPLQTWWKKSKQRWVTFSWFYSSLEPFCGLVRRGKVQSPGRTKGFFFSFSLFASLWAHMCTKSNYKIQYLFIYLNKKYDIIMKQTLTQIS